MLRMRNSGGSRACEEGLRQATHRPGVPSNDHRSMGIVQISLGCLWSLSVGPPGNGRL